MSGPAPVPDNATLEHHGIRGGVRKGESWNNLQALRELSPLAHRAVELEAQLNSPRCSIEMRLAFALELTILSQLLGGGGSIPSVESAYRRTFHEWLVLFEKRHREVNAVTLRQQLTYAWHAVEKLLSDNPR